MNCIKMKWKWRKSYQLKNKIREYLKCIKGDLKKSDIWEIQLTITINFTYSKINNIEFMIYDNVDEVIEKNLWITFQIGLRTATKGSDYISGYVC